jgi:Zn-dependent protease with chaperone function
MTELRVLRRIEFALAAYGTAIVLIVLATGIDTIRFHLATALASAAHPSLHDAVVILLAALDLAIVALAASSAALQIHRSRRFLRQVCVHGVRRVREHTVVVVDDDAPKAFCAGLLQPRVHVSSGALLVLTERELLAVVAHEAHHAQRRDPLRLVAVRALTRSLPWAPGLSRLAERHTTVAELAADTVAIQSAGSRRYLAAALVAIADDSGQHTRGIAPERVDHLMGSLPRRAAPDWLLVPAGLSLGLLTIAVLVGLVPGGRDLCSEILSARTPLLEACLYVALVMSPVCAVARSAAAAVRIPD